MVLLHSLYGTVRYGSRHIVETRKHTFQFSCRNERSKQIFVFKITLNGTLPPIWRCIHVPAAYNFYQLSMAIQQSMGWAGYQLYEYEIKHPKTLQHTIIRRRESLPNLNADAINVLDEHNAKVSAFFCGDNTTATYRYDLDDEWLHSIELQGCILADPLVESYPICVECGRFGTLSTRKQWWPEWLQLNSV